MAKSLKRGLPTVLLPLLLLTAGTTAHAQAPKPSSMEERLRAELRNVTAQLQQARGELEQLKAAPAVKAAAPAPASVGLQQELARSQSQLAEARAQRTAMVEEQRRSAAAAQAATTSAEQYRLAGDRLARAASQAATERLRLDQELAAQRATLAQCADKNAALYATAKDILHAYETLDVLDVVRSRQPFAAQSRVKLEQVAQQYGDQLYQGVFDPRAPATTAAPAAAPQ